MYVGRGGAKLSQGHRRSIISMNESLLHSCFLSPSTTEAFVAARAESTYENVTGTDKTKKNDWAFPCNEIEGKDLGHFARVHK